MPSSDHSVETKAGAKTKWCQEWQDGKNYKEQMQSLWPAASHPATKSSPPQKVGAKPTIPQPTEPAHLASRNHRNHQELLWGLCSQLCQAQPTHAIQPPARDEPQPPSGWHQSKAPWATQPAKLGPYSPASMPSPGPAARPQSQLTQELVTPTSGVKTNLMTGPAASHAEIKPCPPTYKKRKEKDSKWERSKSVNVCR